MTIYTDQKLSRNSSREKPIIGCERAERASRNLCTFASETYMYIFFLIPTRKPENQEKAILIVSEPKFCYFWGLKHTIILNILLINHMVCRYNKLCLCARNTGAPEAVLDGGGGAKT